MTATAFSATALVLVGLPVLLGGVVLVFFHS
jgi:hypothetical protein